MSTFSEGPVPVPVSRLLYMYAPVNYFIFDSCKRDFVNGKTHCEKLENIHFFFKSKYKRLGENIHNKGNWLCLDYDVH